MIKARRITQGIFLLVFLFLFIQTESKGADILKTPAKLFLDFDPLLFLATLLSGHTLMKGFLFSLITLAVTALLGRVFCGWVCPLGTLNNLVGALRKWPLKTPTRRWFRVKYLLLVFVAGASLFGMQVVGLFDPLSLLVRSLSLGVYPAANYGVNAAMDAVYRVDARALTASSEPIYNLLKKSVLAFQQPYFLQGSLMTLLLLVILGLNLVERRFWCRYLCPLGALLGLVGRWPFLKRDIAEGCNDCGVCDKDCQGAAAPDKAQGWKASECLYCMNCDDGCPKKKLSWGFSKKGAEEKLDLGRRNVLVAGVSGAAAVAVSRATPAFKETRPNPSLIRPPGALPEPEFLAKCVKCGECMKVCTTNGLQPTAFEAGLEGLWTPMLVPRLGYCEFKCTLCGQVCPTGAIQKLSLEDKQKTRIGTALFDRSRCLPWAQATPCIVCEEMCPVPDKAIWFEIVQSHDRQGNPVELKQPRVDAAKCTGCGACEAKCPIVDQPAVRVTSIGESRSKKNQFLVSSGGYGGY